MRFATRRIFKSALTSQDVVRELLQTMFVGELLAPGEERCWLVSPWISNIALLDNRAGGFSMVNPQWGQREVRLVEVITDLMARGARVGVATSLDPHNEAFLDALDQSAMSTGLSIQLNVVRRETLHTKGVLLSRGLLTGSMNLTYSGLELNDEMVAYDTTPRTLAQARLNFESYLDPTL